MKTKIVIKSTIIFIAWILLILAFPNKENMMDKICWVIDDDSHNILGTNKTYEEALEIKNKYPHNKIIILKEVQ